MPTAKYYSQGGKYYAIQQNAIQGGGAYLPQLTETNLGDIRARMGDKPADFNFDAELQRLRGTGEIQNLSELAGGQGVNYSPEFSQRIGKPINILGNSGIAVPEGFNYENPVLPQNTEYQQYLAETRPGSTLGNIAPSGGNSNADIASPGTDAGYRTANQGVTFGNPNAPITSAQAGNGFGRYTKDTQGNVFDSQTGQKIDQATFQKLGLNIGLINNQSAGQTEAQTHLQNGLVSTGNYSSETTDFQKQISDRLAKTDELIAQILGQSQPSQQEKDLTAGISNLTNSLESGLTDISGETIPMTLIVGAQQQLQSQANNKLNALSRTLGVLQGNRQAQENTLMKAYDLQRTSTQDAISFYQLSQPKNLWTDTANGKIYFENPMTQQITVRDLPGFQPSQKNALDLENQKLQNQKLKNDIAQGLAQDQTVNPNVLQGMLNVYKSTGVLPAFGLSAKSPLRAQFYAALGADNGQQIISDANTNKAVRTGLTTAYRTQQNLLSANQTAIGTLDKQLALAQTYSDKVNRSDSPLVAKYVLGLKSGVFGDPDTAALNNIVKTASYEFAKILSGAAASIAGVTVNSAADAEQMLNSAMSKGQFNAVVNLMKQEAQFRLNSQSDTLKSLEKDMNNVGNLSGTLTLSDIVKSRGYDYAKMKADGLSDEQIKKAIGAL